MAVILLFALLALGRSEIATEAQKDAVLVPDLVPDVSLQPGKIPIPSEAMVASPTLSSPPLLTAKEMEQGTLATNVSLALIPQLVQSKSVADITVCVPCMPRDIATLPNVFRSIRENTMQPKQVVVALSETRSTQAAEVEAMLKTIFPNTKVVSTEAQQYAGENRNRAVAAASTPYVTFIDADDEMHPQRIQIVTEALQETGVKCVLHAYSMHRDQMEKKFDWHSVRPQMGAEIYQNVLTVEGTDNIVETGVGLHLNWVHHGHPSCRHEVLTYIPFTKQPRGQDSVFLREVLNRYGSNDSTMMFIELPLTVYHPSDHADNAWTKELQHSLVLLQQEIMSKSSA
eukprot:c5336_g1_i1.p1 GENE.c5336_g1_i1~~c5336_g1_i1.p1  ORF type:complete len:343 (+),score=79.19 c5336_g1_i1:23-1051(+)